MFEVKVCLSSSVIRVRKVPVYKDVIRVEMQRKVGNNCLRSCSLEKLGTDARIFGSDELQKLTDNLKDSRIRID